MKRTRPFDQTLIRARFGNKEVQADEYGVSWVSFLPNGRVASVITFRSLDEFSDTLKQAQAIHEQEKQQMPATFTITNDVRDVLDRSTIDANSVALPEQLDRALYQKVNKVLTGAGGKWDRKAGKHLFNRDPRAALGLAIETGKAVNIKQQLQAFYTPDDLADRMVAELDLDAGDVVLEPSAGNGQLVRAVRRAYPEVKVDTVELDLEAATGLVKVDSGGATTVVGDFLKMKPRADYGAVIMNPPFTRGQDIKHVTHALKFLKPGGQLVAIMATGWQTATTKAAQAFRALLDEQDNWEVQEIPAGTFKQSGTNVSTVMLTVETT